MIMCTYVCVYAGEFETNYKCSLKIHMKKHQPPECPLPSLEEVVMEGSQIAESEMKMYLRKQMEQGAIPCQISDPAMCPPTTVPQPMGIEQTADLE